MRAEVPLYSEKNIISGPSVPSVGTNNPRSMCVCVCVCVSVCTHTQNHTLGPMCPSGFGLASGKPSSCDNSWEHSAHAREPRGLTKGCVLPPAPCHVPGRAAERNGCGSRAPRAGPSAGPPRPAAQSGTRVQGHRLRARQGQGGCIAAQRAHGGRARSPPRSKAWGRGRGPAFTGTAPNIDPRVGRSRGRGCAQTCPVAGVPSAIGKQIQALPLVPSHRVRGLGSGPSESASPPP